MKYDSFVIKSEYIRMRDGIELAVIYCILEGFKSSEKFSTILFFTRYGRTHHFRFPLNSIDNEVYDLKSIPDVFTARGYVIIFIDCLGTGASYGVRLHPFFDYEILDRNDIID